MPSQTLAPSCTNLALGACDTTRAAVAADPAAGRGSFTTVTTWTDGARARTVARSFAVETDEPAPLGGTDRAVDPMELLLASLGSCLTIGWVTGAAKRGLDFRSLVIRVEGDYDLAGYLALNEDVRPGFSSLRCTVEVDTDAEAAVLEEIRRAAEATSPMFDNIARPTPIEPRIVASAGASA
ncbi:MAG: OsmC family protein [Chloroflexi bacterium]|nr:OsmC family protein [Chloroflexota bacterium]MDA8236602.1 OsmC family protein [Chloroflexota bacterium]